MFDSYLMFFYRVVRFGSQDSVGSIYLDIFYDRIRFYMVMKKVKNMIDR